MSVRRSLLFRVVASAVVLVTVFGVAELVSRRLAPQVPQWQLDDAAGVVMVGHPTRLWGLGPGERENAGTKATVNELGLRGAVPERPRPAGRQRVLVLGDSTFFGHGVPDDSTLGAQLEVRLREAGVDADVVNGAIPGYSTEQTLLLMEEVGWSVEPTLLLVGNLWSDNNVDGFRDADLLRTTRAFQGNPLAKSAFYQLLVGVVDRFRGGEGAHIVTWTQESRWPSAGERRVPIQDYARNLERLAREAAERGVGMAFVSPANVGMVTGKYQDGASWDPYFKAQRRVAEALGLPLVEGAAALRQAAVGVGAQALFVDVMHPSVAGHAALAGAAATALLQAGWPGQPLLAAGAALDLSTFVDDAEVMGPTPDPSMSPQAQLFMGIAATAPVDAPDASRVGPRDGNPPAEAASWRLTGSVSGGSGEIQVVVFSAEGNPISSVRLPQPGPFTLGVRGKFKEVEVVATDASGAEARAKVQSGSGSVDLRF